MPIIGRDYAKGALSQMLREINLCENNTKTDTNFF